MSKKNPNKKTRKARKAAGANTATDTGLFGGLGAWLRERPSEQFLVGAAVGAAAVYILSNEELRGKILKGGVQLYSSIAGGLAELREQVADIKAEAEADALTGGDAA